MMRRCFFALGGLILVLGAFVVPATADSWQEDFELVGCGQMPAGWFDGGGNQEYGAVWDVGATVCDGDYSMGFFGLVGGCWAALAGCPIDPDTNAYVEHFTLSFMVRAGDETTSGCHGGGRAYVLMSDATHWDGNERALFVVGNEGNFQGASSTDLGSFALRTSHTVQIEYDRVDAGNVTLSYSVDGGAAVEVPVTSVAYEDELIYFHFGSLEGSAWFDDIAVSMAPVGVDSRSWGSVKADFEE